MLNSDLNRQLKCFAEVGNLREANKLGVNVQCWNNLNSMKTPETSAGPRFIKLKTLQKTYNNLSMFREIFLSDVRFCILKFGKK